MRLKPTPAGQIGIFPEHWAHWSWLNERLGIKERSKLHNSRPRVLNLFAYTGATTLYLASQGCTVTHVDASKPTVDWARENCLLSGLAEAPIRWIVDDVAAYVRREIRRNRQYDAILLDPPTYGHGSQGDRWEIYRDLLPLLIDCWQLLSNERRAVLLCGHSSHISVRDLNQAIREAHGTDRLGECEVTQAYLQSLDGRRLDCGFAAKYSFDRT
ncbi:MAG: class I SAM-dependent methyltransferase [Pirellula sp.]